MQRFSLVVLVLSVALTVHVDAGQNVPNLSGFWTPIEPSEALVPPGRPIDIAGSMGGNLTIQQAGDAVTIDNGIVKLECLPQQTSMLVMTVRDAGVLSGARTAGRAWWDGTRLRAEFRLGVNRILRMSYFLRDQQLVAEQILATSAADPGGPPATLHYKRVQATGGRDPVNTRTTRRCPELEGHPCQTSQNYLLWTPTSAVIRLPIVR